MQVRNKDSLVGELEMDYVELSSNRLVMTMPVGPKTQQPAGILHGGASVALAETAATMATAMNIDPQKYHPVGMEINANHVRSKTNGIVTATATPFHKGRTTMVWDIQITDENEKLICVSRCTMAVVPKK
ncbi:hotdog fold thioesterase [Salicibibacter halophilus]|uniref:Hotdog fold thioesterase n=1 Tax=Salicibibacter halophilus TaxID=2502791 RepID=A0A514LM88_9BACI|nr:hotdog fold thioesterase [Salicibibacter halophilus]QDI92956.1 hotdog fold thioesterase [Salicibibacter halophilus]